MRTAPRTGGCGETQGALAGLEGPRTPALSQRGFLWQIPVPLRCSSLGDVELGPIMYPGTAPGSHPAGAQGTVPRSRGQCWCVPLWPREPPHPGAWTPTRSLQPPGGVFPPPPELGAPSPGLCPLLWPCTSLSQDLHPGNLGVRPSPGGEPGCPRRSLHTLGSRTAPDTGGN